MIPQIIECGVKLLVSLIEALPEIIVTIVAALPAIITEIIASLIACIPQIIMCGIELLTSLITDLPKIIVKIVAALPDIITAIVKGLAKGIGAIAEVGLDLVKGLWSGISDAASWIGEKLKGFGSSILDGIKDFFGIASPSKVFKNEVGKNLMLGLADGISDAAKYAVEATEDAANEISGVGFELSPEIDGGFDFDEAVSNMKGVIRATSVSTGQSVSAGIVADSFVDEFEDGDDTDTSGSESPQYIQNNIHVDGKVVARVITPYVAKEIEWEGR